MDFQLPTIVPDKTLRHELENWTLEDLIQELDNISPGQSTKTPVDTKRRVIRAIEVVMKKEKVNGKNQTLKQIASTAEMHQPSIRNAGAIETEFTQ